MTAQKSLAQAAAVLVLAAVSVASSAHHSFAAQYDDKKPVKLTGNVTKVEWTNPHVYLFIDVPDKGGKTAAWGFEMGPPHMLQRAGWKKNSLRDGSHTANARLVKRTSNGEVLGAASSGGQTLTGSSQPAPAAK